MTEPIILNTDDEDYLIDANAADFNEPPKPRTWLKFLKELEEWDTLDSRGKMEIRDCYGLDEDADLNQEIPDELLFERYANPSPQEIAYDALSKLQYDERAKNVLQFVENPIIGSMFTGVQLIGTREELRELISAVGLDSEITVPLYIETLLPNAKTQFVKDRLRELVAEGNDDSDTAESLIKIEEYIASGEPALNRFNQYELALFDFPSDSAEYIAIKKEFT